MRSTFRVIVALAALATACSNGAPDTFTADLSVRDCRPLTRCKAHGVGGGLANALASRPRAFGQTMTEYCADLATDAQNCGGCGVTCAAGEACVSGVCEATFACAASQVKCGDATSPSCADVSSSEADCGGCGVACAADQTCVQGTCTATCQAGETNCGTPDAPSCRDLQADAGSCGACGAACAAGYACSAGSCTLVCATPETRCDPAGAPPYCANLQSDGANCGACGNACGDGRACVSGVCTVQCAPDLVACGTPPTDACVDTTSDAAHCGACGAACAPGYGCSASACLLQCSQGLVHCGSGDAQYCTDSASDPANCGACGNACAAGLACASGQCTVVCGGATPLKCATASGETCVNPNDDPANCGGCGHACAAGESCSNGICQCGTGTVMCGGVCIDVQSDAANCGACGSACLEGQACQAGGCATDPFAPSHAASATFADVIGLPGASLAFDGTALWALGTPAGSNYTSVEKYSSAGVPLLSNALTLKYTSVTSPGGSGQIYGRYAATAYLYRMTSTGSFTGGVTLKNSLNATAGAPYLDASSAFAANAAGTEILALSAGRVTRWTTAGGYVESFLLDGFGASPYVDEALAPQASRLAVAADGSLLTYSNGVLSIWDATTHARVHRTLLVGAGTSADSHWSLSYANRRVWILDAAGATWRGYDVGR